MGGEGSAIGLINRPVIAIDGVKKEARGRSRSNESAPIQKATMSGSFWEFWKLFVKRMAMNHVGRSETE